LTGLENYDHQAGSGEGDQQPKDKQRGAQEHVGAAQAGVEIGRHPIVLRLGDHAGFPPVAHAVERAHGPFLLE
jgi:hypothetical protein